MGLANQGAWKEAVRRQGDLLTSSLLLPSLTSNGRMPCQDWLPSGWCFWSPQGILNSFSKAEKKVCWEGWHFSYNNNNCHLSDSLCSGNHAACFICIASSNLLDQALRKGCIVPHFSGEETEDQRGEVTCPKLLSKYVSSQNLKRSFGAHLFQSILLPFGTVLIFFSNWGKANGEDT